MAGFAFRLCARPWRLVPSFLAPALLVAGVGLLWVPAAVLAQGATAAAAGLIASSDCRPEVLKRPVVEGASVRGELSGFDPCHRSVRFVVPKTDSKPPLVISVHGGGGRPDAEAITRKFEEAGMATLLFDAYQHNAATPRMANAVRQMMLYRVSLQAYQWALGRTDIDVRRIYLYGISNGASVVLNLAAVVDPTHVRGVFSEAPTPTGIGYPDEIRVPVLIAFGKEDDLGAKVGTRRWQISDPCRWTTFSPEAPPGTARDCSDRAPGGRMLTTLQWLERLRFSGLGAAQVRYFDGVAHGAFLGPLTVQTAGQFARTRGFQMPDDMGWSEGATPEGQAALLAEALRFFGQSRP